MNVNWPEIIIGITGGLLIAYIFHRLQQRRTGRRLAYQTFSWSIVSPRTVPVTSELEIRFAGNPIPRLTRVVIAIWNDGWETIDAADVLTNDPLQIKFTEVASAKLLRVRVIAATRPQIALTVTADDSASARCGFRFLDRHDGAVIEVLHTGTVRDVPVISGTIKGLPGGAARLGEISPRSLQKPESLRRTAAEPVIVAFALALLIFVPTASFLDTWQAAVASTCVGLGFLSGVAARSRYERRAPRHLMRAAAEVEET